MTETATTRAPLMMSVSGCRGIVGESLTPAVLVRYADAFARFITDEKPGGSNCVVLARDGRAGGEAVASMVASALALNGVRVIDLGVATTPTAGLMVKHHGADAGLVVTASHNPAEWNGLKAIDETGAALPPDRAARFIELFDSGAVPEPARRAPAERSHDETAAHVHVSTVLEAIGELSDVGAIASKRYKVVVDSVNASGVRGVGLLASALGCELVHINADASGVFPHTPEPTRENLQDLCAQVREHGAVAGFAQDPDADRLAIVDEHGEYIGEEYTLALCAKSLLSAMDPAEASKATLVANLSTSRMIEDVVAEFGASVKRSAVGEANALKLMREAGAPIGGEGNGGVIWPRVVNIRDSIASIALVLRLMASTGRTISELVAEIPSYAIVKRKMPIRDGLAGTAMEIAKGLVEGASVDTQDGVRLDFACEGGMGWLHVRASNTEPILRLIAEAPTEAGACEILDRMEDAISAS